MALIPSDFGTSRRATLLARLMSCLIFSTFSIAGPTATSLGMPRSADFTLLWWANGPQHYLDMKGEPPPAVLCIQSGYLGCVVDTKRLGADSCRAFGSPDEHRRCLEDRHRWPFLRYRAPNSISA